MNHKFKTPGTNLFKKRDKKKAGTLHSSGKHYTPSDGAGRRKQDANADAQFQMKMRRMPLGR